MYAHRQKYHIDKYELGLRIGDHSEGYYRYFGLASSMPAGQVLQTFRRICVQCLPVVVDDQDG